jgi:hypothetical protein
MEQEKLPENTTAWEKREQEKEKIKTFWMSYEDERALSQGDMRCPQTKEWIDRTYCDSFVQGKGCKYKDSCIIYSILQKREE